MKIISKIEIDGFRSLKAIELAGLSDFTTFAGLNNSGKSNILRALNLFFSGYVDEDEPFNFNTDYYRPFLNKKMRRTKEIRISVSFTLPPQFKFRKGLEAVEELLGGREFILTKVWPRYQPLPMYYLDNRELDLNEQQRIEQFLQLINFRYIPNRVLPVDVIQSEHQALRDVLIRRLGRRGQEHSQTFQAIQETSDVLIQYVVKRLKEASPEIGDVRLATPTSWTDMIFAFGYKIGGEGLEVDDSVQGAGIQSLLMLETLYLIDRDYFQKFGWRQAAIWAVEEPESSLHASLEAKVASYLSSIATDRWSRLQILCTTHSDLMLQYASDVVLVKKKDWETSCEKADNQKVALDQMSRAGISRWAHPILHYPLDPLILVEGKYDCSFLEEAFKYIRPARKVRVRYLEQLEGDGSTGGVEALLKYIKAHKETIKSRHPESPVVVVLDWDAARKAGEFRRPFTQDHPYRVVAWPESSFNPNLNNTFRGIERHHSDRIIQEAENRGATIFRSDEGVCSVQPDEYGNIKSILFNIVQEGLERDDLVYVKDFIREILRVAKTAQ